MMDTLMALTAFKTILGILPKAIVVKTSFWNEKRKTCFCASIKTFKIKT